MPFLERTCFAFPLAITVMSMSMTLALAKPLKVYQSTAPLSNDKVLSGLTLLPPEGSNFILKDMPGITICCRFNFKRLVFLKSFVMMIQPPGNPAPWELAFFFAGYQMSFMGFGNSDSRGSVPSWIMKDKEEEDFLTWTANRWHHICYAYTATTSWIQLIKDGKENIVDFEDNNIRLDGIPGDFLNHVYLGRCPPADDDCSRHGGQISDFNMWSRPLTKQEMMDWTSCKSFDKGDIVNWDSSVWETVEMTETVIEGSGLCKGAALGNVLIPGQWTMEKALGLCRSFGGLHMVLDDIDEQEELIFSYMAHDKCAGSSSYVQFWAGWWDQPLEGNFSNVNDDKDIIGPNDYAAWGLGEPNGDRIENCATLNSLGFWNDAGCNLKFCTFCEFGEAPIYVMRGLCPDSNFDVHYAWTGEVIPGPDGFEKFTFRGFANSLLTLDSSTKLWKLTTYKSPNIVAYLNQSKVEYPFGTYEWIIHNDTCSGLDAPTVRIVSLTSCMEDQFSCNDGTCIPLPQRCDGVMQCPDKSDELECKRIIIGPTYLKDLPPPPSETGEKPPILVKVRLYSILNIDEVASLVKLQMYIRLRWKDSRLEFNNLHPLNVQNTLNNEEKNKIWIPSLAFPNTIKREQALFSTERASATVSIRAGGDKLVKGKNSPYDSYRNTKIYFGKDCNISALNYFSPDFICKFDMKLYPFDTQRCYATFLVKGTTYRFVNLVADEIDFRGPYSILQYTIKDVKIGGDISDEGYSNSVSIQIVLGRKLLSVVLTSFVPTIILVCVSFSTNFVSPEHFKAIVTVNLTAMLVIVTLFISDAKSLPKTAYMKMIDIWSISTMSIPFFEVCFHTLIDALRIRRKDLLEKKGKRSTKMVKGWTETALSSAFQDIDVNGLALQIKRVEFYSWMARSFSKYVLPLIFIIFATSFFVIGKMSIE